MGRETKIELLKIFGMIIILIALIFGIVWLNRAQDVAANEINTSTEQTNTETSQEENTEKNETSEENKDKENNNKSKKSEKKK